MEKNDSLFFQVYEMQYGKQIKAKDCVLLVDAKNQDSPGQKCPFCQSILSEGHTKDCMMYEYPLISIWWFILPILLIMAFGYIWIKYKINDYKKKKS